MLLLRELHPFNQRDDAVRDIAEVVKGGRNVKINTLSRLIDFINVTVRSAFWCQTMRPAVDRIASSRACTSPNAAYSVVLTRDCPWLSPSEPWTAIRIAKCIDWACARQAPSRTGRHVHRPHRAIGGAHLLRARVNLVDRPVQLILYKELDVTG